MCVCFLFGHRDAPASIQSKIEEAVERHYLEHGVGHFVVGRYGNFDRMAAGAVKAVKQRHSDICLSLLLPYHPAERPVETPPGFDGTLYPEGMDSVPRKFAIVRANQYMVKNADTVICYVKHFGNTRALLERAQKRSDVYVENLAEEV